MFYAHYEFAIQERNLSTNIDKMLLCLFKHFQFSGAGKGFGFFLTAQAILGNIIVLSGAWHNFSKPYVTQLGLTYEDYRVVLQL